MADRCIRTVQCRKHGAAHVQHGRLQFATVEIEIQFDMIVGDADGVPFGGHCGDLVQLLMLLLLLRCLGNHRCAAAGRRRRCAEHIIAVVHQPLDVRVVDQILRPRCRRRRRGVCRLGAQHGRRNRVQLAARMGDRMIGAETPALRILAAVRPVQVRFARGQAHRPVAALLDLHLKVRFGLNERRGGQRAAGAADAGAVLHQDDFVACQTKRDREKMMRGVFWWRQNGNAVCFVPM